MSETSFLKTSRVDVKDIVEELKEENNRLLKQLLFAEKCLKLFENYRKCLNSFNTNCNCDQNMGNKLLISYLENEYKSVTEESEVKQVIIDDFNNIETNDNNSDINKNEEMKKMKIIAKKMSLNIDNENNAQKDNEIDEHILATNYSESEDNYNPNESESDNSCDNKSKVKENISKLIGKRVKYPNSKQTFCNECELTIMSLNKLKIHNRTVHRENFDESTKTYKCDRNECTFSCKKYNGFVMHRKSHLNPQVFACEWPGCEAAFNMNRKLIEHRSSHEGIRNFVCEWPECGQKFRSKRNLKRHCWIHTDEKHYLCEWPGCGTRFRIKSSLNRHRKLIHRIGEIPDFVCVWINCGKHFTSKESLNQHILRHKGIKPFKCECNDCDMRFVTRSKMRVHFNTRHVQL